MYSTKNKRFYLELRLFLAIIISIIIIFIDEKFNILLKLRNYTENSIYWLYYLYDKPCLTLNYVASILGGYKKLILENSILRQELFLKNFELLLLEQYQKDNIKLRSLFDLPIYDNIKKIIVRVLHITTGFHNHQIVIDRGMGSNIYVGQPVLSDTGIVGQIISVNKYTSRVLLISDPLHSLPVQIKRNNTRMILTGYGCNEPLRAKYISKYLDVCIGDILVTSGLDGCFPEGYPVAKVTNVVSNIKENIIIVIAHPIVNLQCLNYVVLIWK